MIRSLHTFLAGAVLLASAGPVTAGGLYVTLGNPEAYPQARSMGAVLTLQLSGCHEPEKADITAVAIGNIDGQRKSIRLTLTKLSVAGSYAVTKQWPAEGRWVLQFVARDGARVTSTLVASGPDGVEREGAKSAMKLPSEGEIDAMLAAGSKAGIARR